ncbi:MAG: transcriptional repressor [Clostridia bacterium]
MDNNTQFQRKSVQRDEIMKVLQSTKSHPDALWIYEQVKKSIPNISLGTIYRNLAELSKKGMILELNAKDNLKNYDADISSHSHFVCVNCGRIIDIMENTHVNSFVDGNRVEKTSTIYYGVCKKCIEKESGNLN